MPEYLLTDIFSRAIDENGVLGDVLLDAAEQFDEGFFATCDRDEHGWCIGDSSGSSGTGASAAHSAPATPAAHAALHTRAAAAAKAVLAKFEAAIDKVTDRRGLRWIKAAKEFSKQKTADTFKAMEARYGLKTAIAITASAQVLGWGTFGAGVVIGVPLWLPGVSLWGNIPAAVLAETYLQVSRGVSAVASRFDEEDLTPAEIEAIALRMMGTLKSEFDAYIAAHEDELREQGEDDLEDERRGN